MIMRMPILPLGSLRIKPSPGKGPLTWGKKEPRMVAQSEAHSHCSCNVGGVWEHSDEENPKQGQVWGEGLYGETWGERPQRWNLHSLIWIVYWCFFDSEILPLLCSGVLPRSAQGGRWWQVSNWGIPSFPWSSLLAPLRLQEWVHSSWNGSRKGCVSLYLCVCVCVSMYTYILIFSESQLFSQGSGLWKGSQAPNLKKHFSLCSPSTTYTAPVSTWGGGLLLRHYIRTRVNETNFPTQPTWSEHQLIGVCLILGTLSVALC